MLPEERGGTEDVEGDAVRSVDDGVSIRIDKDECPMIERDLSENEHTP